MKNKKLKALSVLISLCMLSTISAGAADFSDGTVTEESSTLSDTNPNNDTSDDFQTDDFIEDSETFDSGEEGNQEFSSEISEEDIEEVPDAGALDNSVSTYSNSTNINAKIESDPSIKTTCTIYKGKNLESQDYYMWTSPVKSYLTKCSDGFLMRVQAGALDGKLLIEYYDTSYNIQKTMTLNLELPLFGAFYESSDNYYILTGATNLNENNSQEVYHVTKYTKNWQSLGSCGVFGGNTTTPFRAGSARMLMYGKYLYIRTCHEMYTSADTYRHQSNLSFTIDTSSMKIFDLYDRPAWGILTGYVSHSLNQFLRIDNGTFLGLDQGDAYPRALVICKNTVDINTGHLGTGLSYNELFPFPGQIGANYTGTSVGGFEFSDSSYLAAGNYDSNGSGSPRNVFVVSASKSGGSPVVQYFTNYAGTEDNASTPHLIKTGSNNFILMWSSRGYVYYTALNGNGQPVGSTYKMAGNLSDCVPSIIDGKLIWYTWYNAENTFYSIDLSDLSKNHAARIINGHKFEYGTKVENGLITRTCRICGFQDYAAVPVSINNVIRKEGDLSYYMRDTCGLELNNSNELSWSYKYGDTSTASEKLYAFTISSSDSSIVEVKQTSNTRATIIGLKPGKATVTIQSKNNPDLIFISEIYVNVFHENYFYITTKPGYSTYNGSEQKPQVSVTAMKGNKKLKEGTDFKVSYEGDFVNAGKNIVKVTGIGSYIGTMTKEFEISPARFYNLSPEVSIEDVYYDGTPQEPEVTVTCGNRKLIQDKDFTVSYRDNEDTGYAYAFIEGIGNYTGTLSQYFYIFPQKLDNCSITLLTNTFIYDGTEKKPDVIVKFGDKQLTLNNDFYLTYYNNIEPGTATVKIYASGSYSGSITKTYKILPMDINDCEITLSDESYVYDGTEKEPYVKIKHGDQVLYEDFDFYVSYSNNRNAGTATVTIDGDDCYSGTAIKTFEINRAPAVISAKDLTLTQSSKAYSAITKIVTDGKVTLASSDPKIVKISGSKIIPAAPGKATITIAAEQGKNYEAVQKTITVTVRPLTATNLTLKSKNKGQVTTSWTSVKSVSGYQIYYSQNSNMKGAKYVTAKSTAKSVTLKKLTSKKKYYVHIRTYKTVNGKKYYSSWSSVKSVTVK